MCRPDARDDRRSNAASWRTRKRGLRRSSSRSANVTFPRQLLLTACAAHAARTNQERGLA
eukprot:3849437-Pleurochrysis_carterae.AAC.5